MPVLCLPCLNVKRHTEDTENLPLDAISCSEDRDIQSLPCDVLQLVLGHLTPAMRSGARLTCHRWRYLLNTNTTHAVFRCVKDLQDGLSAFPNLRALCLRSVQTDEIVAMLKELKQTHSEKEDDPLLSDTPRFLPTVHCVFQGNQFKGTQVLKLRNALSSLQCPLQLELRDNSLGDVAWGHLADGLLSATGLEELCLRNNRIGDTGAARVADLLKLSPRLCKLDLSYNALGAQGLINLRDGIVRSATLSHLNLSNSSIGKDGSKVLGELIEMSKLRSLLLTGAKLGPLDASHIARGLSSNPHLVELDLSHNWLEEIGSRDLAESLSLNQTLEVLRLNDNNIGDAGASVLAEGLKKNRSIHSLYLEGNRLTSVGGAAVSSCLATSGVKCLSLAKNRLEGIGGCLVVSNIGRSSVEELDLRENLIGNQGAVDMATGFHNTTSSLKLLKLGRNGIMMEGMRAIEDSVRQHRPNMVIAATG